MSHHRAEGCSTAEQEDVAQQCKRVGHSRHRVSGDRERAHVITMCMGGLECVPVSVSGTARIRLKKGRAHCSPNIRIKASQIQASTVSTCRPTFMMSDSEDANQKHCRLPVAGAGAATAVPAAAAATHTAQVPPVTGAAGTIAPPITPCMPHTRRNR